MVTKAWTAAQSTNRTIKELKLSRGEVKYALNGDYQSHHQGIETIQNQNHFSANEIYQSHHQGIETKLG